MDSSDVDRLAPVAVPQPVVSEGSEVVHRMLLNDNKAGMEGLDKEKINQIIHEASKGSKFYENEKSKEEQMKKRIADQMKKMKTITETELLHGREMADRLLAELEQQRDLSRTIVHIDMDAFYAAVEMRDQPSLRDKPMAVGGNSMLSTSNYHARKFGVRAAMPGFIGKKLCPDLVIVPLNFDKYTAVSKQVRAIFSDYDTNFCPMSLDEAYLDITDHLVQRHGMSDPERTYICRNSSFSHSEHHCLCDLNEIVKFHGFGQISRAMPDSNSNSLDVLKEYWSSKNTLKHELSLPVEVEDSCKVVFNLSNDDESNILGGKKEGESSALCPVCGKEFPPFIVRTFGQNDEEAVLELRSRIEQRTRLTASAGIAPNMMLAKVCSDKNKPNGQYKIPATHHHVRDFIKDLPTRKISGIGKVSEAMLNALGVFTCTDLYEKRALLFHLYSNISFNYFMRISLGIGSTAVERDSERKSMSTERTFSEISKPSDLYKKCDELSECLAADLVEENLMGKTVAIKIKTIKFEVRTRAHTLRDYTRDKEVISRAARELLRTEIQLCAPQPLKLRLMGVRMSSLVHPSQVKKQNTIISAMKKLSEKAGSDKKFPIYSTEDVALAVKKAGSVMCHNEVDVPANCQKTEINTEIKNNIKVNQSSVQNIEVIVKSDRPNPKFAKEDLVENVVAQQVSPKTDTTGSRTRSGLLRTPTSGRQNSKGRDSGRKSRNVQKYDCPVCGTSVSCGNLREFNQHVDECLEGKSAEGIGESRESAGTDGNKGDLGSNAECVTSAVRDNVGSVAEENNLFNVDVGDYTDKKELESNDETKDISNINSGGALSECEGDIQERNTEQGLVSEKDSIPFSGDRHDTKEMVCEEKGIHLKCMDLDNWSAANIITASFQVGKKGSFSDEILGDSKRDVVERGKKGENCNDERISTVEGNAVKDGFNKTSLTDSVNCDSEVPLPISSTKDFKLTEKASITDENNEALATEVVVNDKKYEQDYCITDTPKQNKKKRRLVGIPISPTIICLNETGNSNTPTKATNEHNMAPIQDGNNETSLNSVLSSNKDSEMYTNSENFSKHKRNLATELCREVSSAIERGLFDKNRNSDNLYMSEAGSSRHDINSYDNYPGKMVGMHDNRHVGGGAYWEQDGVGGENAQVGGASFGEAEFEDGNEEAAEALLVCPVCNIEQRVESLEMFNSHVDTCLSRGTISEILREQRHVEKVAQKRTRETTPTSGGSQSAKRRKTLLPSQKHPCRSIASFFTGK